MSASEFDADFVGAGTEFATRPPLVLVGPYQSHITPGRLRLKRGVDVVVSFVSIIVALPFALGIAIAVKLSSPGPVIYRQERVGRDGRVFVMLKFRTMRDGTHGEILGDPDAVGRYAANDFKLPPDDPRITPLGRILRKTSVDELPQLLNVLFGQMSLVGIRPIEAAQLALRQPADREIYAMLRPGLTPSADAATFGRPGSASCLRREG